MKESRCFVCKNIFPEGTLEKNREILLPVCVDCKGTDSERIKVDEHLDSLAEGFVCGCI